jgi:hypothetical protein
MHSIRNEDALRAVRTTNGNCALRVWDTSGMRGGKSVLRYRFEDAHGAVLFEGADFGASPAHAIDSDATLLALLSFLTLKPGDTDSDYFADYTPAQMEWARSSECEFLSCDVSTAEEVGGCACDYVWTNTDDWECGEDIRGTISEFTVLDHGEDGSQYFPGCGTGDRFEHVATGVGDTAREALEDALEMMAMDDARPSPLQEKEMRDSLTDADKSAFDSLDHSECDEDHSGDDWNHYVSIRYNIRGEVA